MAELRWAVEELERELLRLSWQQIFMERLLEDRTAAADWVGEKD